MRVNHAREETVFQDLALAEKGKAEEGLCTGGREVVRLREGWEWGLPSPLLWEVSLPDPLPCPTPICILR